MQSVLSRIWTRVTVSISYEDNHYTTYYIQVDPYRAVVWTTIIIIIIISFYRSFNWCFFNKSFWTEELFLEFNLILTISVGWMVFASSFDFQLLQSLFQFLGTVPRARINITVILIFHSFFCFLKRFKYLSIFLFSFIVTLWFSGMVQYVKWQVLFLLLINRMLGLLSGIGWSVCV